MFITIHKLSVWRNVISFHTCCCRGFVSSSSVSAKVLFNGIHWWDEANIETFFFVCIQTVIYCWTCSYCFIWFYASIGFVRGSICFVGPQAFHHIACFWTFHDILSVFNLLVWAHHPKEKNVPFFLKVFIMPFLYMDVETETVVLDASVFFDVTRHNATLCW